MAGAEEARVLKSARKLKFFWCIPTEGLFFRCIYCHPVTGKGISLTEWGSGIRLHARSSQTHRTLVRALECEMTSEGPGVGELAATLEGADRCREAGRRAYVFLFCFLGGVVVYVT